MRVAGGRGESRPAASARHLLHSRRCAFLAALPRGPQPIPPSQAPPVSRDLPAATPAAQQARRAACGCGFYTQSECRVIKKFGPRRVPATPSDFAAAPRAAAAAVAATTPTARPVDASRAASSEGAPQVVAPAPAVPLQSPPPSELMDVDPSAGPPSQAVAVQPVLQPLSLGTPKESDTAAPCPAPTRQPSTQRQETLPLFVGPDAPSRPVPDAAPVVTGVHPDLGFQNPNAKTAQGVERL
ncbi:uncharacterized protein LOC126252576 [Schistocerca nitens]|uniref:uncharacterized protein LOC126252576 n=1 Tax=Schistocerca nitens TaxID=7011 RepID=UPI002118E0D2|nr:uncharacterized protein LOC126252576 [Schistocerca nitens]